MALNKASLKTAIESVFTSPPSTRQGCADALASAYRSYAAGATSCLGGAPNSGSLGTAETTLATALGSAFAGTDPATVATAVSAALTAFWLTPPIAFSGTPPGVVTAVGGTAALTSGLPTMWAAQVAGSASASAAAQAHADLVDTFTKTVLVLHSGGGGCSGAIL